jgi:hypothetical protein
MKTTVSLISATAYPVETIFCLWHASRAVDPLPVDPEGLHAILACDPSRLSEFREPLWKVGAATKCFNPTHAQRMDRTTDPVLREKLIEKVERVFRDVVDSGIPVSENIDLVFQLTGVSVTLREQMVRHRIGHHFGDRLGVDIIPDLADSTWWSQTMRVLDMSRFATDKRYVMPESVIAAGTNAIRCYDEMMQMAQDHYVDLLAMGVPVEDARNVIPLAAQHSISWKTNLSALKHIVGKRGCWIAQLGLWEPVIRGMVEEVSAKIHPYLRSMIDPPCFSRGEFKGCHYIGDGNRRVAGEDDSPPCSLYLHHHRREANLASQESKHPRRWVPMDAGTNDEWQPPTQRDGARYTAMREAYAKLWRRDPDTGCQWEAR